MRAKSEDDRAQQRATLEQPLSGVRVLEFGHVAAGPYTGSLLADLGADVVKIESPHGGDQMRLWPPIARNGGEEYSHNFASLNRGKRSAVFDLRQPSEVRGVQKLISHADVLLQNYRPGLLEKLGLGFESVKENHRGLVYCSISGFGEQSPYALRTAYDVVIQGMSGLMSITGEPDGAPVKAGVPVADFITGLYAALTVTAALPVVRSTGRSILLDCPMLDCLLAASALQTSEYWGTGRDPQPLGSAHPRNAPYQAFRGSDRHFIVAAGSQKLWETVCAVAGLEHLIGDARFQDQQHRAANQGQLAEILQQVFVAEPAEYWVSKFAQNGVPTSFVARFSEILTDDHVTQSGLLDIVDVPVAGPTPMVNFPVRFGQERGQHRPPPRLGEHTDEVKAEWAADE